MGIITTTLVTKNNIDLEELDLNIVRYRPCCLEQLVRSTKFTRRELQILYRGFKQDCPSGTLNEEAFVRIFSQFFPQGDAAPYAHFVFNAFDKKRTGNLTFEQFVHVLSVVCRGSLEQKLLWMFSLYDANRDGYISRHEMQQMTSAVYDLLGKHCEPPVEESHVRKHAEIAFQKMDVNKDGLISLEEFMQTCGENPEILQSIEALSTMVCSEEEQE